MLDLDLSWTCAACWRDRTAAGGRGTVVTRAADEDDVVLCADCHTNSNVAIATHGRPFTFSDGTPTIMQRHAELSGNGVYRYSLERAWLRPFWARHAEDAIVTWIGLNPSDADHLRDDPTLMRMAGFVNRWGRHRMAVVNAFAFRSSTPDALPSDLTTAAGPSCDEAIERAMRRSHLVIACWGAPGSARLAASLASRVRVIRAMADGLRVCLHALATTGDGAPKHPLARGKHRIPDLAIPTPWSPPT